MAEFIPTRAIFSMLDAPAAQDYASDTEDQNIKLNLYKAAISGKWGKAEAIFAVFSYEFTASVNQLGETVLHIATAANRYKFVKHLVHSMTEEDLATKTVRGDTAFSYAAVCGHIKIAEIMLKKNPALATIRGGEDMLPIRVAALHGHHRMVRCLYKDANHQLGDDRCRIDVLIALIGSFAYDIANEMVSKEASLATQANKKGETALSAFAGQPQITTQKFRNIILSGCICRRNEFRRQGFKLLKLVLEKLMSNVEEGNSILIKKALFIAAEQGNWEFLTTLIDSNPGLAFEMDENCHTIFHIAILYRHVKVFNIIHDIDSIGNVIKLMKDRQGNNILHLVGKYSVISSALEVVPGAALQLQRELIWYEEVKKMVGAHQWEAINNDGKTPILLFTETHEDLRAEGERWMKETVNSCMVVSTLVAGVAFASSITVPGGNGSDTGIPNFLHYIWFKIFAVSLISSASSILFFLTVYTSHYSMDDFKRSLPLKFILGLLLLSGAVQAMIGAFVAAFFIISEHQMVALAYPIAAVAAIPLIFFFILYIPLFLQVVYSTFTGFFLFKSNIKFLSVRKSTVTPSESYFWSLIQAYI